MRNKRKAILVAAVVMTGMLTAFPVQAEEMDTQENVRNELNTDNQKKLEPEIPELLCIDGVWMKPGDSLELPGGGTVEVNRDENTQELVLKLMDAVIGSKEEQVPITTKESIKIQIQGNCTINGKNAIVYAGEEKCQVTLEKAGGDALLTVNADRSLIKGKLDLFNYCNLQINVNAESFITNFSLGSENVENHGNLSISIKNETEDSFGEVSCNNIKNRGTFLMQEAEGKDEFDLYIEKLETEEGSRFTVKDGLVVKELCISGGVIETEDTEDTGEALKVSEKMEMNGGEIRATGGEVGFYCGDNMSAEQIPVSITNGKIEAEAKKDTGRGMEVVNCNLMINGGEYRMKGGTDYYGALQNADVAAGLALNGTEAVIGGCKLEASGALGIGHDSSLRGGDLTILSGAEIDAKGMLTGIEVYSANLVIKGGTIRAEVNNEESWVPIVTQAMWFDSTTEEEKQEEGHLLLGEGITLVNGAKGMSVQRREISNGEWGSRYFEFLGTAESSVQIEANGTNIEYKYENVPLSVELTDSHEHMYSTEGEIIQQATAQKEGVIRYYCETCGGYRDDVIPKLSGGISNEDDNESKEEIATTSKKPSTNPQTGDTAFPVVWIMLGSIAVVVGIAGYKHKKML